MTLNKLFDLHASFFFSNNSQETPPLRDKTVEFFEQLSDTQQTPINEQLLLFYYCVIWAMNLWAGFYCNPVVTICMHN